MSTNLSTVTPDFNGLRAQLEAALLTKPRWKDRVAGATGQTLLEFSAAVGAYSQFSIESAFQEAYPESAKNFNSLYAAANYLGVRYNRKLPASVQVELTSPSNITLPVYSQFNGAGTYWFNRTPIVLVANVPQEVTLYQGQVTNVSLYGLSTDFQAFVTPEKEFVISDNDVLLKVNSVSIPVIQAGLWTKQSMPGVQDFTLPSGQMILLFGNDIYGTKPLSTDLCEITYVITLGADGANVPTLTKVFSSEANPTVSGPAVTQASGGGNQANPLIYKNVTPALAGSYNSSVTPQQYKKLPLLYPGVIDGFTLAQREVNPRALSWMNVIKVCLLTETVWGPTEWNDFEQWFYENTMYSGRIFREDPTPAPVTVTARIFCKNLANLGEVQVDCEAAIDRLFEPRQGIIGLDVYRSDIIDALKAANSNVDYVILEQPVNDIILQSLNVPAPVLTPLSGSGFIGPGTYDYGVSIVSTLGGETAPANWSSIVISSGTDNRIQLNWSGDQANVDQYKIWGRVTGGAMGLIATVPANTLTFIDDGSITPTGTVPVQSTVASYYPSLVSKTLTVSYTTRDALNF